MIHHKNEVGYREYIQASTTEWLYIMSRKLTTSEVIEQFRAVHGNTYDYSNFAYDSAKIKSAITCKVHGDFFQSANNHKNGKGCPKCKAEKISKNQILSHGEVIEEFQSIHGNTYDYSKFEYRGTCVKSTIICKVHGEFEQSPSKHKSGRGCPRCAHVKTGERTKGGYDNLSPEQRTRIRDVWLYHLELQHGGTIFHKVGITGDLRKRFNSIKSESQSTIVNGFIKRFSNAEIAFSREQRLLNYLQFGQRWCEKTKTYIQTETPKAEYHSHPIKFGGSTECFTPVTNPLGWNLDLNNIPEKSSRFKYHDASPMPD